MSGLRTAPNTLYQTPLEEVRREMDFSRGEMDSDETVTGIVSITSAPTGLSFTDQALSGQKIQFIVSGGSVGTYVVTAKVSTSKGQLLEMAGRLILDDA